ncbi:MAG: hypothetical protein JXR77_19250 [Lentisphaeria bacterium]|nr:hypothetical protein [Lentisphaeria bacterium]
MNRILWFLLNAALLAAAYGVTVWVLDQKPEAQPAEEQPDAAGKGTRTERRGDRRAEDAAADEILQPGRKLSAQELALLWEETLFRPERREDVDGGDAPAEAVQAPAFNLELVGLAKIGERAVAVIMEHRAGAVPRVATAVRTPAGTLTRTVPRMPAPPAAPGAGAAGEEAGPPNRHVYKVGDEVGSSGYTVKEIRLEEEEVVLVKGNEERILNLDKSDDLSSKRVTTAVASVEAQKRAEEADARAAAAAAAARLPLPPPPPPVADAAAGAPPAPDAAAPPGTVDASLSKEGVPLPSTTMSREERLERARLLRERILQRQSAEQKN